jgi:hypothetical protein
MLPRLIGQATRSTNSPVLGTVDTAKLRSRTSARVVQAFAALLILPCLGIFYCPGI